MILDNYPNDDYKQKIYNQTLLNFLEYSHKRYSSTFFQHGIADSAYLQFKIKPKRYVVNQLIATLSSIGEKNSSLLIQRYAINHIYKRDDLGNPVYVDFENTKLPVPKNYHDVLVEQYGEDWNTIPNNRITHEDNTLGCHKTSFINLTNSFYKKKTNLLNQINHGIFKKINYKYLELNKKIMYSVRESIGKILSVRVFCIDDCTNFATRYPSLFSLILYYQFSPVFIGRLKSTGFYNWYSYNNPYLIKLKDEAYISILQFLLQCNKINLARKYINLIKSNNSNNQILSFYKEIETLCLINKHINSNDINEAYNILNKSNFILTPTSLVSKLNAYVNYFHGNSFNLENLDINDGDNLFFYAKKSLMEHNINKALTYFYIQSLKGSNALLLFEAIRILNITKSNYNDLYVYLINRVLFNFYLTIGYDKNKSWKLLKTKLPQSYFELDINYHKQSPDLFNETISKGIKTHISNLKSSRSYIIHRILTYAKTIGVDLVSVGTSNSPKLQNNFIIMQSDLYKFLNNLNNLDSSITIDFYNAESDNPLYTQLNVMFNNYIHLSPNEIFSRAFDQSKVTIFVAKPVSDNKLIRTLQLFNEKVTILKYSKYNAKINFLHGLFFYLRHITDKSRLLKNFFNMLKNMSFSTSHQYRLWVNNTCFLLNKDHFNDLECSCSNNIYFNHFSANSLMSKQLKRVSFALSKTQTLLYPELIFTDYISDSSLSKSELLNSNNYLQWNYLYYIRYYLLGIINKNYNKLKFEASLINQYALYLKNEEQLSVFKYTKNLDSFKEVFAPFVVNFKRFYKIGLILISHKDIKPFFIFYFQRIEKNDKFVALIKKYNKYKFDLNPSMIDISLLNG